MRATRFIGIARQVHVRDLKPGMAVLDPIIGYRGNILVCKGEVLSVKHVEQLKKLIERPGVGCLLNYTMTVWAQTTDASGDEKPACEADPYQAFSVQRLYSKNGTPIQRNRDTAPKPSTARKVYKMVGGKLTEMTA